jgi:transcriptional regulator with XRE-family HTH domain
LTDFADYLRAARERAGLTQSELAARVGLTGSYISVLESRKKPPPSDPVLRRLARALGVPEQEILETAHLDRSPDDIRERIRRLDRHLRVERKLTKRLLTDLLPSSLWHFGSVRGFHEAALEKLRLDAKRKRILRGVLSRLGPLTTRDDFEERSRLVIESLPEEERSVLFDVIPELVREPALESVERAAAPMRLVPLFDRPPTHGGAVLSALPVLLEDHRPGCYFVVAGDGEMAPRVERGDRLLVVPGAPAGPGSLVLAEIEGRITVRQAAPSRSTLLLVAANAAFPPVEAEPEAVLGVVTELRRRP